MELGVHPKRDISQKHAYHLKQHTSTQRAKCQPCTNNEDYESHQWRRTNTNSGEEKIYPLSYY